MKNEVKNLKAEMNMMTTQTDEMMKSLHTEVKMAEAKDLTLTG